MQAFADVFGDARGLPVPEKTSVALPGLTIIGSEQHYALSPQRSDCIGCDIVETGTGINKDNIRLMFILKLCQESIQPLLPALLVTSDPLGHPCPSQF